MFISLGTSNFPPSDPPLRSLNLSPIDDAAAAALTPVRIMNSPFRLLPPSIQFQAAKASHSTAPPIEIGRTMTNLSWQL